MPVEGCWVKVYEDENYGGKQYRLEGPVEYRNLKNLPGSGGEDFGDKIGSLRTGPNAYLQVFNDENFGDDSYIYGPNSEIAHLPDDDDIDSLKISDHPF
jgi:hypothetical protein